eukprot:COSAG02_NODE_188_length_30307_cov_341.858746_4_plen_88_part_00
MRGEFGQVLLRQLLIFVAPAACVLNCARISSLRRPIHRMWKVKWETAGEMTQWETAVQKYAREVREVEESTRSRQRHYYKGGGGGAR